MMLVTRRAAVTLFALLALLLVAGCIPSPPAGPDDASRITREVIAATNRDRVAYGLAPLYWNGWLAGNAAVRSCQLADSFTHQDLGTLFGSPGYEAFTTLGENISRVGGDPAHVTGDFIERAFMASPGHRANILNPRYHSIGAWTCIVPHDVYTAVEFGG